MPPRDHRIETERARNLRASFARKFPPVDKATHISGPARTFDAVGGLAGPKDELLTFTCAATSPEVYGHWGTFPPTGETVEPIRTDDLLEEASRVQGTKRRLSYGEGTYI